MAIVHPRSIFSRPARPLALLCLLASLGCGGAQLRAGVVHDHPVYYVDEPPPRYREYPSAYYRGRPAYLIDSRWYYSTPRGWVYFRDEPRELRVYRERRYRRADGPERYRAPRRDGPTERRRYTDRPERPSPRDEPTERRRRSVDD